MKRRLLKKWNRGLLCGGFLLLTLIVHTVIDTVSFQRETVRIEVAVREYVEQSPQMAILPSPYNKVGSPADESAALQKQAENERFLRRYWSFTEDAEGYNQGDALLTQVREVVAHNAAGKGSIASAKGIVQSIHSIRKTGFRRAEVSFSYTGSIRYTGDVRWVLFGAGQKATGKLSAGADSAPGSAGEEKLTPSGEVTAILVKTGGEWKFDHVEASNVSLN